MAEQHLQPMQAFFPQSDPTNTSARWSLWMERFNTYLRAMNITDNVRKRAILLYQVGDEVYKIFKTLPDTGTDDDYNAAVEALTKHFEPAKNRLYQTYLFRQAKQQENETIDAFHTRLRQLAKHCEFHDEDFEIKLQIVCNGKSSRIRKNALRQPEIKLADMLIEGRKCETSSAQAIGIENKSEIPVNTINKMEKETKKCFSCGFNYPRTDRPCPAKDSTCNKCGKSGHFARVCKKPSQGGAERKLRHQPGMQWQKNKPEKSSEKKHARYVEKEISDNDSSDSEYAYAIGDKKLNTTVKVKINSVDTKVLVDTGASVDLIDAKTFDKLKNAVKLTKTNTKIFPYGSNKPLPMKGEFQATVESKSRYTVTKIYVLDGTGGNLLSAKTAQELNLVELINRVSTNIESETKEKSEQMTPKVKDSKIQEIIDKYDTVFIGDGKLTGEQVKLHIKDSVKPVIQPQRRIPYHMRKEVTNELKKLEENDIIEKVKDQPTPWISPIVCTPKKDGGTRICVDMREANQAIERERHLMPTLSDFKAEVNGSKYFSKIDLKQAYHQIELAPESRYITTFTTHEGLYMYKRLNYGTSSAAEIFQNILQRNLSDIRNVKNIADDIILYGKTRAEHDRALENCLKRLKELNLKAKGAKCKFLQNEIKFYGLIFTADGTRPDPERVNNLVKAPAPKDAKEVRSFLGMANTCHEYIKNYAQITNPLRELTKKNAPFKWTYTHQKAFEQLKKSLTQTPVMGYFDVQKRSLLIVDGSPLGISAILCQRRDNSDRYTIIAYASRGLTPVEQRYSQTDVEGLSLVWGIQHF